MPFFLLLLSLVSAGGDSLPTVYARRCSRAPRVDGSIEALWSEGDSAKHFIQREPKAGEPAADSTTVYFLFDDANLYVAFKCYAQPDRLMRRVTPRDQQSGDNVGLLLDTFDDKTGGYYFVTNVMGVQSDARISEDGDGWDQSWDGVWYSAARIADYGYCVEMRIPFKSVRYRPGGMTWGMNLDRSVPVSGEASFWAPQRSGEWRVSKSGRLTGIEPRVAGMNLEIYPFGLVSNDWQAAKKLVPSAGLDFAWFPDPASSVQATVNPDFAQIEADPTLISLGRYELELAELRPFFIEGADLFSTDIDLLYSRRIGRPLPDGTKVPILGGLKFTSHQGGLEIAGLDAVCPETPYDGGVEPLSNYSALRLRLQDSTQTSLGLLYAGKENRRLANRGVGLDGHWQHGDLSFSGDLAYADYRSRSDTSAALAGTAELGWQSDRFNARLSYNNTPAGFNIDSGIGYAPSKTEDFGLQGGPTFNNLGFIRSLWISAGVSRFRDNEAANNRNYGTNGFLSINGGLTNNWGGGLGFNHAAIWDFVSDAPWLETLCYYPAQSLSGWLYSDPSFPLTASASVWGETRSYNYLRHYFAPDGGIGAGLSWRVIPSLGLGVSASSTTELDTLARVTQMNWIFRPNVRWAVTRDLQFRLTGEVIPGCQTARASLLFSWNMSPKSWLYVAWNEKHELTQGAPVLERIGVVKLSYLFYF
jgi:hypothetical protein